MPHKIYVVLAVRNGDLRVLDMLTLHATLQGAQEEAGRRNPLTWTPMDGAGRMFVGSLPNGTALRVVEAHDLNP